MPHWIRQALDRVGVVARPGLRRPRQQPGVEPRAAARARLEQDVREALDQAPVQVVHAEDVAVEELALPVGRDRGGPRLGDEPVHVPLDVVDRRAREHRDQCVGDVIDDLGPAEVEHELLAALRPFAPGDADRPLGVGTEQVAVRVDHLGLDPHAEVEAERMDVAGERLEAVRELAPVDDPVAQRRVVLVAPPEPAVVEHEQLDPEVLRLARDPDDPLVVEVEVGRLPVVEHDRARAIAPRAARHPLPVQAVERLGQAAEALAGPGDHGLGRGERRPRLEAPREGLRVDADAQAGGPERVDLGLGEEVAGVDEAQAVGLAGVLGRRRAAQGEERAVLGAARAPQAPDATGGRGRGAGRTRAARGPTSR